MTAVGNIAGVRMSLLIGPDPVATPASPDILSALQSLEVSLSDSAASGVQMTFAAGRSGPFDMLESRLLVDPRLQQGARVVVTMVFGVVPTVIFDGIILSRIVRPGGGRGEATLTLQGRDLSVRLDREQRRTERPAQDETSIAAFIAAQYPQYGLVPLVVPPPVIDPPVPIDRTPVQTRTDLGQLQAMAARYGYETYLDPGPAPLSNRLYWGPPVAPGIPQRTLSVNQGATSDAFDVDVQDSVEDLTTVETSVLDRQTGQTVPVVAPVSSRPPLGAVPQQLLQVGRTKVKAIETSGLNAAQAYARALGEVDAHAAGIRVTGRVDSLKYNAALKARAYVDLRGVGLSYDGTYKVSEVRHRVAPGSYEQSFTLTRGELGPKAPVVRAI